MPVINSYPSLLELTSTVVAAYLSHNSVPASDVPNVISAVMNAMATVGTEAEAPPPLRQLQPAVPIRKSITPDFIICLEDGRKMKMLKQHLRLVYQMTPDDYRQKWGLPPEYPMVAPSYAKRRSDFARSSGLGRSRHARR